MAQKLKILKINDVGPLGTGTFATVRKGYYNNQLVAFKLFDKKSEAKAEIDFLKEVKELQPLSHPNIIKLIDYGKYQDKYDLVNCMVIEYADVGSLHSVLYDKRNQIEYTLGHAISWLYQCSSAINYLHTRTPKPILHRDLKPLNLLLMNGGLLLKVCDFGTACNLKTLMSLNIGSPCWLSPETLTSQNYNEKCDVYSYSIVLWEVIVRQKPYFHLNDPSSQQIMIGVNRGELRPLKIANCPKLFELLFERGISRDPEKRPSMGLINNIMEQLNSHINKEPLAPIVEVKSWALLPPTIPPFFNQLSSQKSVVSGSIESLHAGPLNRSKSTASTESADQYSKSKSETNCSKNQITDANTISNLQRNQSGRLSFNNPSPNATMMNVVLRNHDNDSAQHQHSQQQHQAANYLAPPGATAAATMTSTNDASKTHRRSRSWFGVGSTFDQQQPPSYSQISSSSEKEQTLKELNHRIEAMRYDPLEPMYDNNESIGIFNDHKMAVREDKQLQKNISNLQHQFAQLDTLKKHMDLYNDLVAEKTKLQMENRRLEEYLNSFEK